MAVRLIVTLLLGWWASLASAEERWVEVGADPQGKYYVDANSLEIDGETLRFRKKGIYNFYILETFGDKRISFKESVGTIELDCRRRIHRIVQMDILTPEGEVQWSTGKLNRMWEDIPPNSLAEEHHRFVCKTLSSS